MTKKLSQAHITFIGFPVRRKTPAPLLEETTTKGLELLVGNNFPHSLTTYTIVEQKPPIYICHAATASDHHYCTAILHTTASTATGFGWVDMVEQSWWSLNLAAPKSVGDEHPPFNPTKPCWQILVRLHFRHVEILFILLIHFGSSIVNSTILEAHYVICILLSLLIAIQL